MELDLHYGFLGQISKQYISLIAKLHIFNSVDVWLYLTVSKLDFILVIPTMHVGLRMNFVLCRIAMTTSFEIGE
jgi:hypothetical protein